jgi:signal peptidase I
MFVALHDLQSQKVFRVIVQGDSMSPTLVNREQAWATSVFPRLVRDDLVVLRFNDTIIIKRVKFLPGDVFWVIKEDEIHWTPVPDDVVQDLHRLNLFPMRHISVPQGFMWIEGDNKPVSEDSRVSGLYKTSDVMGVVTPWLENRNTHKQLPLTVERIYELRKQGRTITRDQIIK